MGNLEFLLKLWNFDHLSFLFYVVFISNCKIDVTIFNRKTFIFTVLSKTRFCKFLKVCEWQCQLFFIIDSENICFVTSNSYIFLSSSLCFCLPLCADAVAT